MDEWTHIESGRQDHHVWVGPCGDAGGEEPEVPPDASSSCPKWPQQEKEGEEEECSSKNTIGAVSISLKANYSRLYYFTAALKLLLRVSTVAFC